VSQPDDAAVLAAPPADDPCPMKPKHSQRYLDGDWPCDHCGASPR
jgi:hypothetical protein